MPDTKQLPTLTSIYEMLLSSLGESNWWPAQTPLEVIIGAILTQNTAWTNVEKALENLRNTNLIHDGYALLNLTDQKLAELIKPAGFFTIKTKCLKATLHFFAKECNFNFQVFHSYPLADLREKILTIHGIGPETADSIILYALNMPTFVVDAYTKRLFIRHGFPFTNLSYKDIQNFFMANLPTNTQLFNEYHALIVRACKLWCHKNKQKCNICPLNTI